MPELLVLSTSGCAHCNQAITLIKSMIANKPRFSLKIVNVLDHPAYLEKYPLMASPGIVIDDTLIHEGAITEKILTKIFRL